jgi:hypothetical protein
VLAIFYVFSFPPVFPWENAEEVARGRDRTIGNSSNFPPYDVTQFHHQSGEGVKKKKRDTAGLDFKTVPTSLRLFLPLSSNITHLTPFYSLQIRGASRPVDVLIILLNRKRKNLKNFVWVFFFVYKELVVII